ncbi:hypothetical protein HHK36_028269 [Tetracentron sinense]|uniref:Uncharacterized protein n=1 Tax=Tetracentron sinense TaxID=13715 RepID=A0A834YKR9_TETSI|nr:hypothetical protein HHK36_028269 [Tetracentron sinense]
MQRWYGKLRSVAAYSRESLGFLSPQRRLLHYCPQFHEPVPFPVNRSFKSRFRTMNDGTIRRWRAGKRHNAHLKVLLH